MLTNDGRRWTQIYIHRSSELIQHVDFFWKFQVTDFGDKMMNSTSMNVLFIDIETTVYLVKLHFFQASYVGDKVFQMSIIDITQFEKKNHTVAFFTIPVDLASFSAYTGDVVAQSIIYALSTLQ